MRDLHERELNPLKVLHHFDRLRALAAGCDVAPVTVEIDLVAYCNHHCAWCVDPWHRPEYMPAATFERLVEELADFRVSGFGVEGIVLKGGGEPTLHPDFGHLLGMAARHGFGVGVVTNGSQLLKCADELARYAAYVRISIDGPNADSHRLIHGSDDFAAVVAGVRRLVIARGAARHPLIGLSFATTSSKKN